MLRIIDAHTHIQFAAFEKDREEVIKRTLEADVGMVNVGTQKDTSKKAVELAERYDGLWAAVGLHPIHTEKSYHDPDELGFSLADSASAAASAKEAASEGKGGFKSRGEEFDYDYYKDLASHPKVVAIGECGLDYYRIHYSTVGRSSDSRVETAKEKQKTAFIKQIELAKEVKKPLMIHCRSAFPDLIEILNTKYQILVNPPGIIHFFSGTKEDAEKLLEMGFYFTFGGVITFVRDYDEVIKLIPLDRILAETDAPYVAPEPYRGKRNEPIHVVEAIRKIAEIRSLDFEETRNRILQNTKRVLSI